jgi:hypothetical protein
MKKEDVDRLHAAFTGPDLSASKKRPGRPKVARGICYRGNPAPCARGARKSRGRLDPRAFRRDPFLCGALLHPAREARASVRPRAHIVSEVRVLAGQALTSP